MNPTHKKSIIGIMTGMSMDGIDLAHIHVSGDFPNIEMKLVGSHSMAYDRQTKAYMQSLKSCNIETLAVANIKIAELISDCVHMYLQKNALDAKEIDAIGSHGQALYHQDTTPRTTLQIGSPSIIAEKTGITCISNFRLRDIAAGGSGAPFAPLLDQYLMKDESSPIGMINLGSISNISVIHNAKCQVGFDMGPANLWADYIAKKIPNNPKGIDYNGELSKKGKTIPALLQEWMNISFLSRTAPKSAGYQDFPTAKLDDYLNQYDLHDLLKTAIEFSALCIKHAVESHVPTPLQKIYLCGGGVYNPTLVEEIKKKLTHTEVLSMHETHGKEFNDNKEAILFAVLCYLATQKQSAAPFLTTGSKTNGVYGEIALGNSLTV